MRLHGIMAEFENAEALLKAARASRQAGFTRMDAYSPLPVEGLDEAMGIKRSRLSLIVLLAGIFGCIAGFYLQYWVSVDAYAHNIGGKPMNSWPMFIPVTFEVTILCAALSAVIFMIGLNGLPMPYHPVFNVERFQSASKDRYFLCIESRDPKFDPPGVRRFLESQGSHGVYEVED